MNKKDKRQIAVAILPWAGLRENIVIGLITFWPWDPAKVEDDEIKNQLTKCFNIFIDNYGKIVNSITICSHGKPDFRIFEKEEFDELKAAINILAFCSICPIINRAVCSNNNRFAPPNSEHLEFFGQTFSLPNDNSIVTSTRTSTSFDTLDEFTISKPLGVFNFVRIRSNEEVTVFNGIFENSFDSQIRERILRSLEWFKFAHTEGNNVSESSRLIMMSTAFEILLNFPENQKAVYFARQIENKLKKDKSINETRTYNGQQVVYTKAACWAYDFYKFRNKIVHGEDVEIRELRYKDWITHSIVADLVYYELILNELFDQNCFIEKIKFWSEKYNITEIKQLKKIILDDIIGFGIRQYHEALGWVESKTSFTEL